MVKLECSSLNKRKEGEEEGKFEKKEVNKE